MYYEYICVGRYNLSNFAAIEIKMNELAALGFRVGGVVQDAMNQGFIWAERETSAPRIPAAPPKDEELELSDEKLDEIFGSPTGTSGTEDAA